MSIADHPWHGKCVNKPGFTKPDGNTHYFRGLVDTYKGQAEIADLPYPPKLGDGFVTGLPGSEFADSFQDFLEDGWTLDV